MGVIIISLFSQILTRVTSLLRGKKSTYHNFIDFSFADERIHYRKSPYRAPPGSRLQLPARLRDQPSSYSSAQKLTRWSPLDSYPAAKAQGNQSSSFFLSASRSLSKAQKSRGIWPPCQKWTIPSMAQRGDQSRIFPRRWNEKWTDFSPWSCESWAKWFPSHQPIHRKRK